MDRQSEQAPWLIRRADINDAEAVWSLFSHEAVYPDTLQLPFTSLAHWQDRVDSTRQTGHHLLAACDRQKPAELLGVIGLHPVGDTPRVAHVRTLGLAVHPDYAGRGIGSALLKAAIDLADNWLNVTRLSLGVFRHNRRAIALYERHGFLREGISRGLAFGNGRYLDSIEMARLHPRLVHELEAQADSDIDV